MWAKRCFSLTITALMCWQYLLREAAASCASSHPQQLYCDADYVFKFKAMTWPASSSDRVGRRKRMVPGGGMMEPRKQTAKVQRFYKGRDVVMPMMTPLDTFSVGEANSKMEATIRLGLFEKPLKKNAVYVYLGKMFRYRNNTMMPMEYQVMMARCGNTMPLSTMPKVVYRGIRKKYAQGCKAGCRVQTIFSEAKPKSKTHCYWNPTEYNRNEVDCRKTAQFCHMGKLGYCKWKITKAYKKCVTQNKISNLQREMP